MIILLDEQLDTPDNVVAGALNLFKKGMVVVSDPSGPRLLVSKTQTSPSTVDAKG